MNPSENARKGQEQYVLNNYSPSSLEGWSDEDIRLQIGAGRQAQEELRKLKDAIKVVTASVGARFY